MAVTTQRIRVGGRLRGVPKPLWAVLGVALVVRLAWVLWVQRDPPNFGDPFIYINAARGIAEGDGYHVLFWKIPTAFHPIGYPGWLAGIVSRDGGLSSMDTPLHREGRKRGAGIPAV